MDGELTLRSLAIQSRMQKRNSESKIVGPISSTSTTVCSSSPTFKLPDGWAVEARWRRDGSRCDKYYYEPDSGRQFRSLLSIQQFLDRKTNVAPKRLGNRKNCYIEPGTGKRFRSLISAQRYLRGDPSYLIDGKVYAAAAKEGSHNMQIVPHNFNCCGNFTLPESWIVEEKPRSNVNYAGTIDKLDDILCEVLCSFDVQYYIEPGTGKRFRSLKSVESYLSEGKSGAPKALTPGNQFYLTDGKEYKTSAEVLKLGELNFIALGLHTSARYIFLVLLSIHANCAAYDLLECSNSSKSHMSSDEVEISIIDLCNPPAKIKWVLNPGGNMWRSFVEDAPVPESLRNKWGETFIRCLNKRY